MSDYCKERVSTHWDTGLGATTDMCHSPLPCLVHEKPDTRIWTLEQYRKAIRDYLRMGMVVICPRQVGKTTALLQLAWEMLACGERVTIQSPTDHMSHVGLHLWHKLYPAQRAPVFTYDPRRVLSESKVLIDEYCRVSEPYGDFFAATDSLPGALGHLGLDSAERAQRFARINKSPRVRVILPMFTTGSWDEEVLP